MSIDDEIVENFHFSIKKYISSFWVPERKNKAQTGHRKKITAVHHKGV